MNSYPNLWVIENLTQSSISVYEALQTSSWCVCVQAEFVWHKLSADNMDPDFVERRRVGLENFLLRVALHPVLSNDKILHHFLTEVRRSEAF